MTKITKIFLWISIAFILAAIGCVLAFNLIGSTIDAEGYLHEPFYLVPFSLLSLLAALVTGVIALGTHIKAKRQRLSKQENS